MDVDLGDIDFGIDYLTDMSGDFKPRRFGIGDSPDDDILYIDNLLNSYSDKFNSTTVFQIPKYCKKGESFIAKNLRRMLKINIM